MQQPCYRPPLLLGGPIDIRSVTVLWVVRTGTAGFATTYPLRLNASAPDEEPEEPNDPDSLLLACVAYRFRHPISGETLRISWLPPEFRTDYAFSLP